MKWLQNAFNWNWGWGLGEGGGRQFHNLYKREALLDAPGSEATDKSGAAATDDIKEGRGRLCFYWCYDFRGSLWTERVDASCRLTVGEAG